MSDLIDYKSFEDFVRDIAKNWDCDTGANGSHPYYCRACNAGKLLNELEQKQRNASETKKSDEVTDRPDLG